MYVSSMQVPMALDSFKMEINVFELKKMSFTEELTSFLEDYNNKDHFTLSTSHQSISDLYH